MEDDGLAGEKNISSVAVLNSNAPMQSNNIRLTIAAEKALFVHDDDIKKTTKGFVDTLRIKNS